MAKANTAPVQTPAAAPVAANAPASAPVADKANEVAAQRKAVMDSATFPELMALIAKSARWHDVAAAADAFAPFVAEAARSASDGKPSAIARKAASVAPQQALAFRLALASYSLSGRKANGTQLAELGAKLPALAKDGSLRDRTVTYGGLTLPPIVGEL